MVPCSESYRRELEEKLDMALLAQEIEHNVLDTSNLLVFIASKMKEQCAPIRDMAIDEMVKSSSLTDLSNTFRQCFAILETMKLDVANHQLKKIIPYIIEHQSEFETNYYDRLIEERLLNLTNTKRWLAASHRAARSKTEQPCFNTVCCEGASNVYGCRSGAETNMGCRFIVPSH